MSKLKKEVRGLLDHIVLQLEVVTATLSHQGQLAVIMEKELDRLREENSKLLDRVMAVDYAKLATYSPGPGQEQSHKELPDDANEDMAGEILSVPEGED